MLWLLPTLTPQQVATSVVDAVWRRRDLVVMPWLLYYVRERSLGVRLTCEPGVCIRTASSSASGGLAAVSCRGAGRDDHVCRKDAARMTLGGSREHN